MRKIPLIEYLNPIYINKNGIIKATDEAKIGERYELNGASYVVVNEEMLRGMVDNGDDVTKVVTTNVTNMSYMFEWSSFNQPIGNWDVSNVTDMSRMFHGATSFNQDISKWDVSKVTNVELIFMGAVSFNPKYIPKFKRRR